MLAITQEVVPVEVFNIPPVNYRVDEFAEDTKESSDSLLRQTGQHEHILKNRGKQGQAVGTFHELGNHLYFMQQLNSFARISS